MKHNRKLLMVGVILLIVASLAFALMKYTSSPKIRPSHEAEMTSSFAATLSGPLNLTRLVSQTDVIVIGKVLDISNTHPSQARLSNSYEAKLRVDRVLKGSSHSSVITVEFFR